MKFQKKPLYIQTTPKRKEGAVCRARRGELRSLAQAVVEALGKKPENAPEEVKEVISELEAVQRTADHDLAGALREEGEDHRLQPRPVWQSSPTYPSPFVSTLGKIYPEDQGSFPEDG